MNAFTRTSSLNRLRSGFSLVEVALAVAIAALGIITCLGLLPEGMEMSKKTASLAINSNIVEQIIRDIENASGWRTLKPTYQPPSGFPAAGTPPTEQDQRKYYDYQGTSVPEGDTSIAMVASIDYNQTSPVPGPERGQDQQFLARVIIRIAATTNSDYEFNDEQQQAGSFQTFFHYVAKQR
jgi:uncharacterized protein (TIGR02598 family)